MTARALNLDQLAGALRTQRYGRSITYFELTGSTNDDARAALSSGAAPGHIVVAEAQSSGRGSRGRSWASPPGTDLYVSVVDRLPLPLAELPPLTLAVGLGIAEAVDELLPTTGPKALVKWPNDVQLAGKKCAGVLVEASLGTLGGDAIVIGVGLNVNRTDFPAELADSATSLCLQHAPLDRNQALQVLLERIEQRVDSFVRDGAAATARALRPRLALLDQPARCDERPGIVRGVADTGALLFETAQGIEHIIAGRLLPTP